MARILEVFLSSTALDLELHRTAIHAELISTGLFHCVRQEDFGAQDAGAVEFCREKVKASVIFLGLTGHRRGWEPDGDNAKRSITEMEHDWAKEAGCRRFLYVAPDNFPVPGNLRDTDEQHARQKAFRERVMAGGERIVSQKGFESPDRFAADIVKHLLTQLVTGDLITLLRPELLPQKAVSPDEQRPAIAAAVERLAEDQDVDLLVLAKNPKNVDLAGLELKLRERADAHEAEGRSSIRTSAEYWRHIGALAFLHNTQKALAAYERAVSLDPSEPEGWRYLGELQYRLGELAHAEQSFDRVLALGKSSGDLKTQALGSVRLGWISRDHGDLTKAEALIADAVKSARAAGWWEGLARAYGNLAIILHARGNLDEAEKMQSKALGLYEELGNREGMAGAYGNLGLINQTRGDLDKAEEMHRKSFEIEESLGNKEGMAADYGNLGVLHHARGDFGKAEEMHLKALALNEQLGRKDGMADSYGNLGEVHQARGDLDKAEVMQRQALELYTELGNKDGMAVVYGGLGNIEQIRGNLGDAEAMHVKALKLSEELGNKEGMARAFGGLGNVHQARGDLGKAEEMQREAHALHKGLGSKEGMARNNFNLGIIYQKKGDEAAMRECWRKACDLYREMGLLNKVAEVEGLLATNRCGDS